MTIESYELRSASPLAEAYIHRTDQRMDELFGYHPTDASAWGKRLKVLKENGHLRADARQVASVLKSYNERFGASSEVLASIEALAGGAPVVVGGQQAGLWTGPLLVIHKAVTIIGAAKHASAALGAPVVPVFWIAGEDHDWEEANHTYVMSAEQEQRKLSAARPEGPRTSVSRTSLSQEQWDELLSELEQTLPHSEFKADLLERLGMAVRRSVSLSDLFAGVMMELFGRSGLILLDADDTRLRKLESPMFNRLIEQNDELEQAYTNRARTVTSYGYQLQADVTEGSSNLFYFNSEQGDERTLLHKREGHYVDRRGTLSLTQEQLLHIAAEAPEQLSNNVLTRPLMQDYLLPVLGTVLGPGEIAYWSITGEAFRTLGMQMPIVIPRMSFTLIEGTVAKHMTKYELSFEDVAERFEDRKRAWLEEQDQLSLDARFSEVKSSFLQLYTPIVELAGKVQAGLVKLGETNRQKIVEQIEFLEARTKDAYTKQFDASIRQLDRIGSSLRPLGKPQERVANMTAYWNRYGPYGWLDRLLEAPYDPAGGHRLIYL
ncbi:bacillithiol biosynthesis cysteine-adding enzyme BshC [Paenibacillus sp. GCM10023252]|uniref:bacillithiol biosynthesis cysteine-adding enzyme BshC n=1 Tax=Paenibacillus sp. GCM10023252 TaxID=3252649 RepID=UPI003623EBFA